MCDCYTPQGEPIPTNKRAIAQKSFEGHEEEEVWFGLEQEFTLFNLDQKTPLGWPVGGMPSRAQGPYYCSAGPENNFGRSITDSLYKFDFASPTWSPDLAGISMILAVFFFLLFLVRLGLDFWFKNQLKHHA